MWLSLILGTCLAALDPPPPVAADACLVRVVCSAGAKLTLDGDDQGQKREFAFAGLDEDSPRMVTFVASLPGDRSERRDVVLLPGERITVPIATATPRELVPQVGHPGKVTCLAFGKDGRHLFSGAEGSVILWDTASGRELRRFRPLSRRMGTSLRFNTAIVNLAVSPDERTLLAGATDGGVYVWDVETGRVAHTDEGYADPRVALSQDGRTYAIAAFAASVEGPVILYKTEGHKHLRALATGEKPDNYLQVSGIDFNRDGTKLVLAGYTSPANLPTEVKDPQEVAAAFRDKERVLWVWRVDDGRRLARIRAHDGDITAMAMSPAGERAATASEDHSLAVWDLATGQATRRFTLDGTPRAVTFGPDGKHLVAAVEGKGRDPGVVTTWDLATGSAVRTIRPESATQCLVVSPDGQQIAMGCADGGVRLVDSRSGATARLLRSRASPVKSVAITKDDRRLAVGSAGGAALVWKAGGGAPTRLIGAKDGFSFERMCWTPDGKRIVAIHFAETASWDGETGGLLWSRQHEGDWFRSVAAAPDGSRLLLGGNRDKDAVLLFVDAADGRAVRRVPIAEPRWSSLSIYSVAFAADGRLAAVGFVGQPVKDDPSAGFAAPQRGAWVISGVTGDRLRTLTEQQPGSGIIATEGHVAFGRRGSRLLVGAWEIWDHQAGQMIALVEGHATQIQDVAFTPDGARALTASWDHTARLWEVAVGRELRAFHGHTARIECADISPDGRTAATGGWDGRVILWNLDSGERIRTLQVDEKAIHDVRFSPDGRSVLAGSFNGSAILWRTASGYKERTFSERGSKVPAVTFVGDGSRILAGFGTGAAGVWNRGTGRLLMTLSGHTDPVTAVAASPRGDRYLTGSLDKTVILWDAATGRAIRTLRWHSAPINQVTFSPDGRRALTTSWDNAAMMWDVESGSRLRAFQSSMFFGVPTAAFSPDGRRVITGSLDRRAAIWDAETGDRLVDLGAPVLVKDVDASDDGRHVAVGTVAGEIKHYDAGTGRKLHEFRRGSAAVNAVRFTARGRFLLSAQEDGTARLWDVATGDELASLFVLDGGREWLVTTPEGLFDGSTGGEQAVLYRVGTGLEVRPPEPMPAGLRHPGLLPALLRGERPMPRD